MLKKFFHLIVLAATWLTLSPLFCYWVKQWNVPKALRIFLLLVSPLFDAFYGILLFFLLFVGRPALMEWGRRFQYSDNEEISPIVRMIGTWE